MIKKILAAACLAVVLATSTAEALPAWQSKIVFYSDASHAQIVGWLKVTCYGVIRYGMTSEYAETFDIGPCSDRFNKSDARGRLDGTPLPAATLPSAEAANALFQACISRGADTDRDGVVSAKEALDCLED